MMRRWLPIVMIVMAGAAMPGAQASLEYNVKAALLLNFARYIDWPEAAFADASTPVSVCVFGGNPFGDVLERTLQGESIDTRSLEVRQVRSPADSDGCHLLFVPAGAEARARTAMHRQGAHAVTVGESRRFEDLGGAHRFPL